MKSGKADNASSSWNDYQWTCKHCKTTLKNLEDVRVHSKEAHNNCYAFSCVDCEQDLNSFNAFVEHVRVHREYLRLFCQYCNQKFKNKDECTQHTLSHWSGNQRICDRCGEIFPDQKDLTDHKKKYKK